MRYELQQKQYNHHNPAKTRWDTIECFYDTEYGKQLASDTFDRMSRVDKHRTYRLVTVTEATCVLKESA